MGPLIVLLKNSEKILPSPKKMSSYTTALVVISFI